MNDTSANISVEKKMARIAALVDAQRSAHLVEGAVSAEERFVLENTLSGGVTLGDVIRRVGVEDLPFGGVGPSGMGCYTTAATASRPSAMRARSTACRPRTSTCCAHRMPINCARWSLR